MSKKRKNCHVGGEQMPLITPDSDWTRPRSLPDLRRVGVIALDRECRDEGLRGKRGPGWAFGGNGGHVCGTSIAWREGGEIKSAYLPIKHPDTECFDADAVARWEIAHQKAGVRFVMQNAPYDVGWGHADLGVPCPELVDDTTCMATMIDENRLEYNLDALCAWRGLPGKDERLLHEAADAYGYGDAVMENLWRLPARYVGRYAEVDAIRTLQLRESLDPEIDKYDPRTEIDSVRAAYQLEMDLLPLVHEMRRRGIRVDLKKAELAYRKFKEQSRQALEDLSDKMGQTVGIDELRSNDWLVRAFDTHRVPYPRDAFTGRASFDAKWLKGNLIDSQTKRWQHWLPELLIRAKGREEAAEKFVRTYIVGFAANGRLHASINQFRSEDGGTRTYRFSYELPPLQQMPHRDEELSEEIRGCFLPEEGEWWFGPDYSQQEYRQIVHFAEVLRCSKAKEAGDRYRKDPRTDYHSMVATMTDLERKPAKDANFAKSYGAGIPKFATMINKSQEEAKKIMEQYDEKMPFVTQLFERCQAKAESSGYIRLLDGARIHFETWEPTWLSREERGRGWSSGGEIKMAPCSREEAEQRVADEKHPWHGKRLRRAHCRKAMNALIQGSSARQTKMAMRACKNAGHVPLIQMHDELGFSISSERQGVEITEIMTNVVKLRVPMLVDARYGRTWGDARHTWKERNK